MYLHPNANIEASAENCPEINKPTERRQRLIPLAFTNSTWGREYVANPNWEYDNLDAPDASGVRARQGSRFGRQVGDRDKRPSETQLACSNEQESEIKTHMYGHDTKAARNADFLDCSDSNPDEQQRLQHNSSTKQEDATTTDSPGPITRSERPYSVMTAWRFFRTVNLTSPISEPDEELGAGSDLVDDAPSDLGSGTGPWMQVLMCWNDFDEWRLHVLTRSFSSPGP